MMNSSLLLSNVAVVCISTALFPVEKELLLVSKWGIKTSLSNRDLPQLQGRDVAAESERQLSQQDRHS